jgi:hypothetical protein
VDKGTIKICIGALTGIGLALLIGAIWAPYGEWPQGQLAWTAVALLVAAFFAVPLTF